MAQEVSASDAPEEMQTMKSPGGIGFALQRLETAMANLAAVALLLIMAIVVADVVMRYFFASPLVFSYDLISMYLVVVAFFFAIPDTLNRHGHVAIDVFQPRLPPRLRFGGESLAYAAGTVVMGLIAWKLSEKTWIAWSRDEVTATLIPWPIWLSNLPAALGCWVFALRCAWRCAGHFGSAIAGRALIEMPPEPITSHTQREPA
jgi:TRAP-type C4-dicarboxylate transport system permease small subunit